MQIITEPLEIEFMTKFKFLNYITSDTIKLPLKVAENITNNQININLELLNTEELTKIYEGINNNIDEIEWITISIEGKEPITFRP